MRGQIARKIDVEDHDGDDVAIVDRSRHCLGGVQPDETTDVRASRRAVDHLAAPGPEILVVDAQIDVLDLERGAFIDWPAAQSGNRSCNLRRRLRRRRTFQSMRLKIWRRNGWEPEKRRDAFGGYRPAEQVTLYFIASMVPKVPFLFRCFDSFSNNRQAQSLAQSNDGICNRLIVGITG